MVVVVGSTDTAGISHLRANADKDKFYAHLNIPTIFKVDVA